MVFNFILIGCLYKYWLSTLSHSSWLVNMHHVISHHVAWSYDLVHTAVWFVLLSGVVFLAQTFSKYFTIYVLRKMCKFFLENILY